MQNTDVKFPFPLDAQDWNNDRLLSNLQGNIIKGHGRDYTVHCFIRFDPKAKSSVLEWVSEFAEEHVTSCKEQLRQRELYKRNGTPGGVFAGICFTKSFYQFLGDGYPLGRFTDEPFKAGMKARKNILNDPDVSIWEEGSWKKDDKEIHAMILLAHDDLIELGEAAKVVCDALNPPAEEIENTAKAPKEFKKVKLADIINTEYGAAIRNANGDGLEHFGYVDGISQPLFLKDEIEDYKKKQPFFGNAEQLRFNPAAKLGLVLVPDPFAQEPEAYGSYFVFRKLEQMVREFKKAEKELAKKLGLKDEEEAERVGAMIVGRYEDGTPLTISEHDKMIGSGIMNNFDYDENIGGKGEDKGTRCPYHAHIRKTNTRQHKPDNEDSIEEDKRMARRGITYGSRNVSTTIDQHFEQMPANGVGLLFMSFQRSIERQFEFIQTEANKDVFPGDGERVTGIDLIIGQGGAVREGLYATKWNEPNIKNPAPSFDQFVHLKGGEYFFAPSIPFLISLKTQKAAITQPKKSNRKK